MLEVTVAHMCVESNVVIKFCSIGILLNGNVFITPQCWYLYCMSCDNNMIMKVTYAQACSNNV